LSDHVIVLRQILCLFHYVQQTLRKPLESSRFCCVLRTINVKLPLVANDAYRALVTLLVVWSARSLSIVSLTGRVLQLCAIYYRI